MNFLHHGLEQRFSTCGWRTTPGWGPQASPNIIWF